MIDSVRLHAYVRASSICRLVANVPFEREKNALHFVLASHNTTHRSFLLYLLKVATHSNRMYSQWAQTILEGQFIPVGVIDFTATNVMSREGVSRIILLLDGQDKARSVAQELPS
jgi:hypothetical protein